MKIKLGILAILISTITLIALVYTLVNLDSSPKVESEANNPPENTKIFSLNLTSHFED